LTLLFTYTVNITHTYTHTRTLSLTAGEEEGDEPVILTDILGLEDALGTMDFKGKGEREREIGGRERDIAGRERKRERYRRVGERETPFLPRPPTISNYISIITLPSCLSPSSPSIIPPFLYV
jgi:hypothetical protein